MIITEIQTKTKCTLNDFLKSLLLMGMDDDRIDYRVTHDRGKQVHLIYEKIDVPHPQTKSEICHIGSWIQGGGIIFHKPVHPIK